MTEKGKAEKEKAQVKRETVGYGSTYVRPGVSPAKRSGIDTVLGGRAYRVRPDQKARTEVPCLWMASGAVKFKPCTNFYDCPTCAFDRAMEERVRSGKQADWRDLLRRHPPEGRLCRHTLTGRIAGRRCAYDYACGTCDFDQLYEEVLCARHPAGPRAVERIRGFAVPLDHHFHTGHTWARIEAGGAVRIGLDDFALRLFGAADGYELPLCGEELTAGEPALEIRRGGNRAAAPAPVSAVVVESNPRVRETPAAARRDPYGEGWLLLVRPPDPKRALEALLFADGVVEWLTADVSRLEQLIEETAGPLAADGGLLGEDIYGALPGLGWERLAGEFLRC